MKKHHISFKYALDGILYVFRTQPNFRIHTFATILVLSAAWFFKLTFVEVALLLFTIMLVVITEMVNTAIEAVTDLLTQEYSKYAKISKDVSAGMVLLAAMMAVGIGTYIFLPHLLDFVRIS